MLKCEKLLLGKINYQTGAFYCVENDASCTIKTLERTVLRLKGEGFMDKRRQKRRNRRKRRQRNLIVWITIILMSLILGGTVFGASILIRQYASSPEENTKKINGRILEETATVDLEHLHSPYAVLLDIDSGETLAGMNTQKRIYPASLTKIMTAVLAAEYTEDMERTVELPADIFGELYVQNASMAGFQPGEEIRLKDLFYGILLPSGAECCVAFANKISGSEEEFVELMNQKAKELRMEDTHFCNSTGLHDPDHYSTVKDISVLLQYALQNEEFRNAFTAHSYTSFPSEWHVDGLTFYSTMFKKMESSAVTGGEILGGKTGYTEEAGLCLASLAQIGGKEYILVTAGAEGDHNTEPFHILDAADVYNQVGEKGNVR